MIIIEKAKVYHYKDKSKFKELLIIRNNNIIIMNK